MARLTAALLVAAAARAYEFSAPHVVTADGDLVPCDGCSAHVRLVV